MNCIVLTGGGSAGHCIPHLAILPHLNEHFLNVCYIGSPNGIEKQIMQDYCDYYAVDSVKLIRKLTCKNLLIPFKLFSAVKSAKKILEKLNPEIVFSKGGYVSLPVVLAAKNLKIPVVAHESDYSMGLANKISARFAEKVLTTFSDTAKLKPHYIHTGAPIREELFYADKRLAKKYFNFGFDKPVLLIIGGSSGSREINNLTAKTIQSLTEKYYVLHICGYGNMSANSAINGYKQLEFTDNMARVFACADMCVSRAGSNTVFELMALKIPTLFIPLSKAQSRGDQIENAQYFYDKGLCEAIFDKDVSPSQFLRAIHNLDKNKLKIKEKLNSLNSIVGNKKIADVIINTAKKY